LLLICQREYIEATREYYKAAHLEVSEVGPYRKRV
jgi:hypothetical protein